MKKFMMLLILFLFQNTAFAVEDNIEIELNKLEDKGGSCRAFLVFKNHTESLFSEFKLDLVMFGADGVISRRLAIDSAPLRPNKTSVKLFDLEGQSCEDISLILLNDVLSCKDEVERQDCVNLVEASSKGDVPFVK